MNSKIMILCFLSLPSQLLLLGFIHNSTRHPNIQTLYKYIISFISKSSLHTLENRTNHFMQYRHLTTI